MARLPKGRWNANYIAIPDGSRESRYATIHEYPSYMLGIVLHEVLSRTILLIVERS